MVFVSATMVRVFAHFFGAKKRALDAHLSTCGARLALFSFSLRFWCYMRPAAIG
jgi:hypothetical protein